MAEVIRSKPTRMTVCDLCDQEIDKQGEWGSILHAPGRDVVVPRTRWASLVWPSYKAKRSPEELPRRYEFHAGCLMSLVEDAAVNRQLVGEGA